MAKKRNLETAFEDGKKAAEEDYPRAEALVWIENNVRDFPLGEDELAEILVKYARFRETIRVHGTENWIT